MRYNAPVVVDRQFGGNVTVKLSFEEYRDLEEITKERGVSKASIVKGLIREFLKAEK